MTVNKSVKAKVLVGLLLAILILMAVPFISKGYSVFYKTISNAVLYPGGGGNEIISSAITNSAISGSTINGHTGIYSTFYVGQTAVLETGNKEVSPTIAVHNNVDTWLGFYLGYSTVPGNSLYLVGHSQSSFFSDSMSGTWWY